jgi:alpha-ketoglutarate-dependent taurine dioxygenase
MNDIHHLDCSTEQTAPRAVSSTPGKWLAADITDTDWKVVADDAHLKEIDAMAAALTSGEPIVDKPVHCLAAMQRMREILSTGVGFAVFDRLPVEQYPTEVLISIYEYLGEAMGRRVEQKFNGQMLYHVHDSGKQFQYGVRGSHTSIELNFHTDNAFGQMVPDAVGLFCVSAAKSGGISRFCSLYAVHERLEQQYPNELNRLYEPMFFDRQKEHDEQEPPVTWAPFFSWRGDRLFARANPSLVRKGYEVANQPMDTQLHEALAAVDAVSTNEDLWFEAALEPGQIQYLNNHEIGHYRSEFVDHEDPAKRRSLYRLWHRTEGTVRYHGV